MTLALAIALVGLTSLAVALLLLPLLLRRGAAVTREGYNLAVYRDQLAEVERDVGRGVLSPEQAEATRTEIGRRILALGPEGDSVVVNPKSVAAATIVILLLPIAALLIYSGLGSPGLPDRPFAHRGEAASSSAAAGGHVDIKDALAQLRDHLKAHPDDLTGWLLLARTEVGLEHYAAGADAYKHAVDLSGNRADVLSAWGEAQVLAAGGIVTPTARDAFQAALRDPEAAPRSRYYLALAQFQQGDVKAALKAWQALAADSPAGAAWLPLVRQRITEAQARLASGSAQVAPAPSAQATAPSPSPAGMPSAKQVTEIAKATSSLTPDQRQAMIETMVARLAARLDQQPDDVDGWAQLGRSYMVLNQPEKARAAFARALQLKPNDALLKQALAAADSAAAATSPGTVTK